MLAWRSFAILPVVCGVVVEQLVFFDVFLDKDSKLQVRAKNIFQKDSLPWTLHYLETSLSEANALLYELCVHNNWEGIQSFEPVLRYFVAKAMHDPSGLPESIAKGEFELYAWLKRLSAIRHPDHDPCACTEGSDFYVHMRRMAVTFDDPPDTCYTDPNQLVHAANEALTRASCLGGDASMMVAQMTTCLEQEGAVKAPMLIADAMFRFALVGGDCMDPALWRISQKQVLEGYGSMVAALLAAAAEGAGPTVVHERIRQVAITYLPRRSAAAEKHYAWNELWVASAGTGHHATAQCQLDLHDFCVLPGGHFSMPQSAAQAGGAYVYDVLEAPPELKDRYGQDKVRGMAHAHFCAECGRLRRDVWVVDSMTHSAVHRSDAGPTIVALMVHAPSSHCKGNLWHAIHWWVAVTSAAWTRGLAPRTTTLVMFAWDWAECLPGSRKTLQHWNPQASTTIVGEDAWSAIQDLVIALVTTLPVIWVSKLERPVCFRDSVVGAPNARFDLGVPAVPPGSVKSLMGNLTKTMEVSIGYKPNKRSAGSTIRVLLLQRNEHFGRRVVGYDELMRAFAHQPQANVELIGPTELEGLELADQFRITSDVDVLVGVHGAGLAWLVNMEEGSAVIELHSCRMPGWLVCSGQWDKDAFTPYGGLALLSRQRHICLQMRVGNQRPRVAGEHGQATGASVCEADDISEDGVWGDDGVLTFRQMDVHLEIDRVIDIIRAAASRVWERRPTAKADLHKDVASDCRIVRETIGTSVPVLGAIQERADASDECQRHEGAELFRLRFGVESFLKSPFTMHLPAAARAVVGLVGVSSHDRRRLQDFMVCAVVKGCGDDASNIGRMAASSVLEPLRHLMSETEYDALIAVGPSTRIAEFTWECHRDMKPHQFPVVVLCPVGKVNSVMPASEDGRHIDAGTLTSPPARPIDFYGLRMFSIDPDGLLAQRLLYGSYPGEAQESRWEKLHQVTDARYRSALHDVASVLDAVPNIEYWGVIGGTLIAMLRYGARGAELPSGRKDVPDVDDIDVILCTSSIDEFQLIGSVVYKELVEKHGWDECWMRNLNQDKQQTAQEFLLFGCVKDVGQDRSILLDVMPCHKAMGSRSSDGAARDAYWYWDFKNQSAQLIPVADLWPAQRCRAYDFSVPCPRDPVSVLWRTLHYGSVSCFAIPIGASIADVDAAELVNKWESIERAGYVSMTTLLHTCQDVVLPAPLASLAARRGVLQQQTSPAARVAVYVSGQLRTLVRVIPRTWYAHDGDFPWTTSTPALEYSWRYFQETFVEKMEVSDNILWGLEGLAEPFDIFMHLSTRGSVFEPPPGDVTACSRLSPKPPSRLFCSVVEEHELSPLDYMSKELRDAYRYGTEPPHALGQTVLQQLHGIQQCNQMRQDEERKSGLFYNWIIRLRPDTVFYAPLPKIDDLAKSASLDSVDAAVVDGERYAIFLAHPLRQHDPVDAFAVGTRRAMDIYCSRLNLLRDPEFQSRLLSRRPHGWDVKDVLHVAGQLYRVEGGSSAELLVDIFRDPHDGEGSGQPGTGQH